MTSKYACRRCLSSPVDAGHVTIILREELEASLGYYRKAKLYVPDNHKLARRIAGTWIAKSKQVGSHN